MKTSRRDEPTHLERINPTVGMSASAAPGARPGFYHPPAPAPVVAPVPEPAPEPKLVRGKRREASDA